MAEELLRRGWTEADLAARRKSDPGKLAISARLRRETTLPIRRIATRVHLGTSKSANARLHAWMRTRPTGSQPKPPRIRRPGLTFPDPAAPAEHAADLA